MYTFDSYVKHFVCFLALISWLHQDDSVCWSDKLHCFYFRHCCFIPRQAPTPPPTPAWSALTRLRPLHRVLPTRWQCFWNKPRKKKKKKSGVGYCWQKNLWWSKCPEHLGGPKRNLHVRPLNTAAILHPRRDWPSGIHFGNLIIAFVFLFFPFSISFHFPFSEAAPPTGGSTLGNRLCCLCQGPTPPRWKNLSEIIA